jgi:hypothetical protein
VRSLNTSVPDHSAIEKRHVDSRKVREWPEIALGQNGTFELCKPASLDLLAEKPRAFLEVASAAEKADRVCFEKVIIAGPASLGAGRPRGEFSHRAQVANQRVLRPVLRPHASDFKRTGNDRIERGLAVEGRTRPRRGMIPPFNQ